MYQASLSVLNGLLLRFKRALKPRDDIILQFTGARIITLALCYRKFVSRILDLLPEFLQFLNGFLLVLPLRHTVRKFFRFIGQLPVKCFEPVYAQPVIFLFERFSLYLKLCYLTVQFIKLRRHGIKFSLYQCTCLVNKVDGLIRQEPVGNISMAQHRSRYESRIRYRGSACQNIVASNRYRCFSSVIVNIEFKDILTIIIDVVIVISCTKLHIISIIDILPYKILEIYAVNFIIVFSKRCYSRRIIHIG